MFIEEGKMTFDGDSAGDVFQSFNLISQNFEEEDLSRYRQIFSQLPVAILILKGPDFIIEATNNINLTIWGKGREVIGKPLLDVMPDFREAGHLDMLNRVYTTGEPFYSTALPITLTKNGKLHKGYYNVEHQALRESDGTICGLFVVGFDVTSHITTQHQLQESERQFRNLVMLSPVAMGILRGTDRVIELANDALLKIWQRSAAEVEGRKIMDIFPELENQPFPALLDQVYETGYTYRQDEAVVYVKNPSGELNELYIQLQYTPLLDAYDKPNGIIITVNDITTQVKIRKQTEANELYFRKMADNVPAIIFLWKSDGYCTYKNRQWFEYTGAAEEEAKGFTWLNYVDVNSRPEVQQALFAAIKNKTSLKVAFQLKRKDGEYRWFDKAVTPRFDESGRLEGFIGTLTDIHELKLAEEKLKDAEERLRLAVDATGLATFDMNLQTQATLVSPRMLEILGMESEDPLTYIHRSEFLKNVYSEDLPVIENALAQAYQNGNYNYEARVVLPDNSIRWITTRGKIYYSRSRVPMRMIGMAEDITRRKQLEQHKDAFIGIVSHELKTPVTSLKVYTQMLQQNFEAVNDTTAVHMLYKMDSQINKLSTLIKDLLDTARIDSGKLQVEHRVFDLNTVIDEVLEDMVITGNTHEIIKQSDQAFLIFGDPARTAQVITNLLTNAIKYSPNYTKIIINTQEQDDYVLCSVQDFGMGISPDNLVNVFDKFFRINNSSHSTYPGLGLGLFISSEIIRQQGGEIWADSYEQQGSTFWFSLPLYKEDQA